jgi:hypothetical protein
VQVVGVKAGMEGSIGTGVCKQGFFKVWDVGYSWLQDPKSFVFLATHLATVPSRTFIWLQRPKCCQTLILMCYDYRRGQGVSRELERCT